MDSGLFEKLLYEEETTTLDFKSDQYRFAKATEVEKSELIKDILGFANAWRRSEAFILIGVEDVRGARAKIVGIVASEHLDDHSLQQFVNSLTNSPIRFHYEAFTSEDKHVGIIRIEQQARPLFLKRDYGKLKKNEVYVRRGSSTDPSKPAGPDEIAQMGQSSAPQAAEIVVEFANVERDDSFGNRIEWDAELCDIPSLNSIPDLSGPQHEIPGLGIQLSALSFDIRLNPNYFRELANYEFIRRLFRPVRLVIKNVGETSAKNVRVELVVLTDIGVNLIDSSDLPARPTPRRNLLHAAVGNIRPASRTPGDVSIDKNGERFRVEIDCGDLQPGRRVWSEKFYVGKYESGELIFGGQIFADNLPIPKDCSLRISANITHSRLSVDELCDLPEPNDGDD